MSLQVYVPYPHSLVGLSFYLNSFTRWGMRNPIGAITDALRLREEEAGG
jgi:hypothetical protein